MANDILIRQLETFSPRSVLAVGGPAHGLVADYCSANPGCHLNVIDTEEAVESLIAESSTHRYDFGVTAGYLEYSDKNAGAALIARLRDVLVRRLYVILPGAAQAVATQWTDGELTAFGLTLVEAPKHDADAQRVYGYDISSYKRTPDWLNPRHWANPERWNKDRW